jgi:hypothetical protein
MSYVSARLSIMPTTQVADAEQWGPRLHAWLEAYWRANNTNANAWTDSHPGIQGATVSRWKSGTVPSLQAMRSVADALGISIVEVLKIAGVVREGEDGHGEVIVPAPPSIDVAIAQDESLSPLARKTLRDILAAIRAVERGESSEVVETIHHDRATGSGRSKMRAGRGRSQTR